MYPTVVLCQPLLSTVCLLCDHIYRQNDRGNDDDDGDNSILMVIMIAIRMIVILTANK